MQISGAIAAMDPRGALQRVLLVDDEPLVRRIVARMLRVEGFEVVEAGAPDRALSLLERERVHLVLTDVMMPGMNGCELGRRIAERWPDLRVLYYSGHVLDELFDSGICPRDIPFIGKPFSAETLRKRIEGVMGSPAYQFPEGG